MRWVSALRKDWAGSLYKGLSVTVGSAAAITCSWFLTPILLGCAFILGVALTYRLLNTDSPEGGGVEQLGGGMLMALAPALALLYSDAQGLTGEAALAERERLKVEAEAAQRRQGVLKLRGGA